MQVRRLAVVAAGVAAAAAASAPTASAAAGDKVTGGGQVFFSQNDNGTKPKGALSTIGFNAQETADGVKGQVQFVDRSAGKGKNQVATHYVVDCVTVMGNQALIAGHKRGDESKLFSMYVEDNGEGAKAAEADIITFNNKTPSGECDFQDEDNDVQIALARGNVQVHGSSPTDQGFPEDEPTGGLASATRALGALGL